MDYCDANYIFNLTLLEERSNVSFITMRPEAMASKIHMLLFLDQFRLNI